MAEKIEPSDPGAGDAPDFAAVHPHSLYFYYFVYENGDRKEVRPYYHFQKNGPIEDLPGLVEAMARNAHEDGDRWPSLGDSVQDLIRRRISYVVLLIDTGDDDLDQIPFELRLRGGGSGGHTFSRPRRIEVPVSPTKTLVGGYCIDILWDGTRNGPLGRDDYEQFDLYLNFRHRGPHFFPDSGGTNMGPPVPPP